MNEEQNINADENQKLNDDQLVNDESFDTESNGENINSDNNQEQIQQQLKDAQDKYLRLYSDFDNFRKRTQKEKADLINFAAGDVIKDLLIVLDDFERAIQSNESNHDIDSIK